MTPTKITPSRNPVRFPSGCRLSSVMKTGTVLAERAFGLRACSRPDGVYSHPADSLSGAARKVDVPHGGEGKRVRGEEAEDADSESDTAGVRGVHRRTSIPKRWCTRAGVTTGLPNFNRSQRAFAPAVHAARGAFCSMVNLQILKRERPPKEPFVARYRMLPRNPISKVYPFLIAIQAFPYLPTIRAGGPSSD